MSLWKYSSYPSFCKFDIIFFATNFVWIYFLFYLLYTIEYAVARKLATIEIILQIIFEVNEESSIYIKMGKRYIVWNHIWKLDSNDASKIIDKFSKFICLSIFSFLVITFELSSVHSDCNPYSCHLKEYKTY